MTINGFDRRASRRAGGALPAFRTIALALGALWTGTAYAAPVRTPPTIRYDYGRPRDYAFADVAPRAIRPGPAAPSLPPAPPPAPPPANVFAPQIVGAPYEAGGLWYAPTAETDYDEIGAASWYGADFHGRATASGELFDSTAITAAHPTLPIPCLVQVTNLDNGRQTVVRVNDRGPFAANRIIDLSEAAALVLDFHENGVAQVRVRYLGPAPSLLATPTPPVPLSPPTRIVATAAPVTPTPPARQAAPDDFAGPERAVATSFPQPPAPSAPSPSKPAVATNEAAYAVQIAAFSLRANAEALLARLGGSLSEHFGAPRILSDPAGASRLFRVVVGGYREKGAALAAKAEVEGALGQKLAILRLPA